MTPKDSMTDDVALVREAIESYVVTSHGDLVAPAFERVVAALTASEAARVKAERERDEARLQRDIAEAQMGDWTGEPCTTCNGSAENAEGLPCQSCGGTGDRWASWKERAEQAERERDEARADQVEKVQQAHFHAKRQAAAEAERDAMRGVVEAARNAHPLIDALALWERDNGTIHALVEADGPTLVEAIRRIEARGAGMRQLNAALAALDQKETDPYPLPDGWCEVCRRPKDPTPTDDGLWRMLCGCQETTP